MKEFKGLSRPSLEPPNHMFTSSVAVSPLSQILYSVKGKILCNKIYALKYTLEKVNINFDSQICKIY
jgi:hypothetical protein